MSIGTDANTYQGLHACYYDLIYADKPYAEEAQFVAELLRAHGLRPGGKLLDIACGTGRHAVELAAMGFAVTGIDINQELLALARQNAEDRQADVSFLAQDMRRLNLDAAFDGAVCLFDSLGYAVTSEAVLATLGAVCGQLSPGGVFATEFLHAPTMLSSADHLRVRRWRTPKDGELLRVSETQLEPERGTHRVRYELLDLGQDGRYRRGVEEHTVRSFEVEEIRSLLERAGLRPRAFVAAYEADPSITDRTWHVLAIADRP